MKKRNGSGELAKVRQRPFSEEEGKHVAYFAFGIGDADSVARSRVTESRRSLRQIGDSRNGVDLT